MLKILKLNRAILFLLLVIPWAITHYYPFEDLNNYMIFNLFSFLVFFLWFVFLNQELMKRIPKWIEISDTLFLIHLFLVFGLLSVFFIFAAPDVEYKVTGIAALPWMYFFYAVFQIYNHLSKLLTYIEQEKEVEFSKRVGEMVLFFFIFIGIWWLQPRIIRALDKPEVMHENSTT